MASLLIYAPVPVYQGPSGIYAEAQAVNGLRLWADHFDQVTVMMPQAPGAPPVGWVPLVDHAEILSRVRVEPLPMAYRPDQFFKALRPVRARISALIAQADYLSFAIGGLFGDWGAVAAMIAHKQGRPFAVWTDRVESEVVRRSIGQGHWRASLRARLYHRPMARLEKAVIARATLGLFHGQETFDTYAPYCRNPHVVHDIHIAPEDHISNEALQAKCEKARQGPLTLLYAGRANAMKGTLDWGRVLAKLQDDGVDFTATWLGDGDELAQLRDNLAAAGVADRVELPGFTDDRDLVRRRMQQADIFLFCHKTPESPRCLIEALAAGTPIVGYDGSFARDLISTHGGGRLVSIGDADALADQVKQLDADRSALAAMIRNARADGAPYNDVEVFRHRSELIKAHL